MLVAAPTLDYYKLYKKKNKKQKNNTLLYFEMITSGCFQMSGKSKPEVSIFSLCQTTRADRCNLIALTM